MDAISGRGMIISLAQQIACVRRELALRHRAYPRWVMLGKMKGAEADKEIAAMQAVHDTLVEVAKDAEFAGSTRG